MKDVEIEAFPKISEALGAIEDDAARDRVLRWAILKYGQKTKQELQLETIPSAPAARPVTTARGNEIPGVAKLMDSGELKLTVRDLKAKSTNDAAIRLAHIAIYAYETLTGEASVSGRKVLVPLLRKWRAYDGNTRAVLAKQKGLVRQGDQVSLDEFARQDAERFIEEIRDSGLQGSWQPGSNTKRRQSKQEPEEPGV